MVEMLVEMVEAFIAENIPMVEIIGIGTVVGLCWVWITLMTSESEAEQRRLRRAAGAGQPAKGKSQVAA